MRGLFVAAAIGLLSLTATQALAVKKFIPLGHSELEQTAELPRFGSEASDFNLQADIYETNNYWRKRLARETDSRMKQFRNTPDGNPANPFLDY